MRIAWKLRVAGWILLSPRGITEAISSASCAVRVERLRRRGARRWRARCGGSCAPRRRSTARRRSRVRRRAPATARRFRRNPGSMRMSSGPSLPKLKPRSATSSCGDDTPRSNSTPSRPAAVASQCAEVGEAAAADRHARVRAELAFGHGDRLGILVHQQQPASGAQLFQHAARMAAAPERAIQVAFHPRCTAQPSRTCAIHDREVAGRARVRATAGHSCRSSSSSPRSSSRQRLPDLRVVRLLAPQFEFVAHAQQHGLLLDARPRCDGWPACVMRPLPSGSTKVAAPTSFSCRLRLTLLVSRQGVDLVAHALPDRHAGTGRGNRTRTGCR